MLLVTYLYKKINEYANENLWKIIPSITDNECVFSKTYCRQPYFDKYPHLNAIMIDDDDSTFVDRVTHIPDNIKRIHFNFVSRHIKFPLYLNTLLMDHSDNTHILDLPLTLRVLILDVLSITCLPSLPQSLKVIYIERTNITSIEELPPKLEVLCLVSIPITRIPKLPDTLKVLELRDLVALTAEFPPLPNNIVTICVLGNNKKSPAVNNVKDRAYIYFYICKYYEGIN